MRAIIVTLEGAADRPEQSLSGATPLESAVIPNLDLLASIGASGLLYPVAPGICPSSDMALWHLAGYSDVAYPGRAGFEALGAGIDIREAEVIVLVSLASTMVDQGERYVQASPASLPPEDAARLAQALSAYKSEYLYTRVFHLDGPYMALLMSGGASPLVTDTDPLFYRLPVKHVLPMDGAGPEAVTTAKELNRFTDWASAVITESDVTKKRAEVGMTVPDSVLLKAPSARPDIPAFKESWGFDAALCGPGFFSRGLALATGMQPLGDGTPDTRLDISRRLASALDALDSESGLAIVRTTAADEASHTRRPRKKIAALEELDAGMEEAAGKMARDKDLLVVVTAGFTAPSGGPDDVIHTGEAVPVLFAGPSVRPDDVKEFNETSFARGSLGTLRGRDVMPLVLSLTDRARYGYSRTLPLDVPYRRA